MAWHIEYLEDARQDLSSLDNSQKIQVLKAIEKVSENPLPNTEGGLGKPLGNKHGLDLAGLCKIKLLKLGLRVVYKLVREDDIMKIVVVSLRNDDEVYKIATERKADAK